MKVQLGFWMVQEKSDAAQFYFFVVLVTLLTLSTTERVQKEQPIVACCTFTEK